MTSAMVGIGVDWRGLARGFTNRDWHGVTNFNWHRVARSLPQGAFVGGLGLSAVAIIVLLLAAYFAGTAPHLPASAAALETLKTGGAWPPTVTTRTLGTHAAPSTASASPHDLRLLPHSVDPSQAPPIDVQDLPPVEHHFR